MLPSVRVLSLLLISVLACAQPQGQAPAAPVSGEDVSKPAVEPEQIITFTLDFPASQPEHYSIHIPFEGPAHYQSTGRISSDSDDTDSFDFDFVLSPALRDKVFRLS